jgi:hypothetical protein
MIKISTLLDHHSFNKNQGQKAFIHELLDINGFFLEGCNKRIIFIFLFSSFYVVNYKKLKEYALSGKIF